MLIGLSSVISSACVHISEVFTTFVSGISHIKLKNVNKKLFINLVLPGIIGGVIGAYLLAKIQMKLLDIYIDIYLIIMGIIILTKKNKNKSKLKDNKKVIAGLGLAGGISDALGGGGWGPIVTTNLLILEHNTRETIGTVNTAEFFVTIMETTTFVALIGSFKLYYDIILGMIIGGMIAAPIGAVFCKKIPTKTMLKIVGLLVIILNTYKLIMHISTI